MSLPALPTPEELDQGDRVSAVIALVEPATALLERAVELTDANEVRAQAEALSAWAQAQKLAEAAQVAALTIVRRAEVRVGELLGPPQSGTGANQYGPQSANSRERELAHSGLDRTQRSRFRQLAKNKTKVEEAIATATTPSDLARAKLLPPPKPRRKRGGKAPTDPRFAASGASQRSIAKANHHHQYRSMRAAPQGKLNLPAIRKAEQVQQLLVELSSLDPEVLITQIPVERCRQWQPDDARWWLRFTELCEQRRQAETPDVPPTRWPRRQSLALDGEHKLSPTQSAVVDWLRTQNDPQTVTAISEATGTARGTTGSAIDRLRQLGLLREAVRHGDTRLYAAVPLP